MFKSLIIQKINLQVEVIAQYTNRKLALIETTQHCQIYDLKRTTKMKYEFVVKIWENILGMASLLKEKEKEKETFIENLVFIVLLIALVKFERNQIGCIHNQ